MQNENGGRQGRKTSLIVAGLAVIVLVGVVVFFLFGNMAMRAKYSNFAGDDGYIISSLMDEDGVTSSRQYFDANTPYKNTYNGDIEFDNTSGEMVSVESDSFVHYLDGSIGFLKKVAVIDLAAIKGNEGDVITYYNMLPASVLKYSSGGYMAELQNKRALFNAILVKSAENKYLIAAPSMTLKIDDASNSFTNGYLEVTYFDGDIIRVENQEVTYQSISKNMDIYFGDMRLDLRNRQILKNDLAVLDFGMVTIESDDNIVLADTKEDLTLKDEQDENGDSSEGDGGNNGASDADKSTDLISDLADGIIHENTSNGDEEEINEYTKVNEPVFTIPFMSITANSFNAMVEVEDMDGLLTGDMYVEVTEISTGKPMYQSRLTDGEMRFEVNTENLSPETGYVFAVTANYYVDGSELTKTFIQKTFITDAVGISLKENYVSQDSLSVIVDRSDYSDVESLLAVLYNDAGEKVGRHGVDFASDGNNQIINFDNLSTNSNYTIRLEDFHYHNESVVNAFSLSQNYVTLKKKPILGATIFTIDKKSGVFHLGLDDVIDEDAGVIAYRYEVYDARNMTTPVYVAEKQDRAGVDVEVTNDGKIKRNNTYVFRVVAVFDDNQREHEYVTAFSSPMKMDGVAFPTVRFDVNEEEGGVTFESINGIIVITDEYGALDEDAVFNVVYHDSVGGMGSFTASGSLNIPFVKNNLRKNETYTISVYGKVNLKDLDNAEIDNCLIGSVIVKTKDPDPFALNYEVNEFELANAFSVNAQLVKGGDGDTELEANVLSGITFNIYEGEGVGGKLIKTVGKFDSITDEYISSLRSDYYDNNFIITPALFGMSDSDFSGKYTIEVTNAYDYTDYKNTIDIKNNVIVVDAKSMPDGPADPDDAIDVVPILNVNADESHYDANLDVNTVIGYRITADFYDKNIRKDLIKYVLRTVDGTPVREYEYMLSPEDTRPRAIDIYMDGYGTPFDENDVGFLRGNTYYITYTAELDMNSDGVPETNWPTDGTEYRSVDILPKKQEPIFKSYPTNSGADSVKFKYVLDDVDNALLSNELVYAFNGVEKGTLEIGKTAEYREIEFVGLEPMGALTAYYQRALLKEEDEIESIDVVEHKFDGRHELALEYELFSDAYRARIKLKDYNSGKYDKVAFIRLELVATRGESMVIDNPAINDSGEIIINSSDIMNLVGQEITPKISLYYDDGQAGFEIAGDRVAIEYKDAGAYGYFVPNGDTLSYDGKALRSDFSYGFSINGGKLTLTSNSDSSSFLVNTILGSDGIFYDGVKILPKHLSSSDAVNSGSQKSFMFIGVKPGMSVLNENGGTTISPTLVGMGMTVKMYGLVRNGGVIENIKDNKIYMDIYKTDSTGGNREQVNKDVPIEVTGTSFWVSIDWLEPGTNYYMEFYADVKVGEDEYRHEQLYDVDKNSAAAYSFKTLSNVAISNIKINYNADKQDERYFDLKYDLSSIVGISRIGYEIWEANEDGSIGQKVDIAIEDSYGATLSMFKKISISPSGSGVETGEAYKDYKIKIKVYVGDKEVVNKFSGIYRFKRLPSPYVGLNSKKNGNGIRFSAIVVDNKKTIVGGAYKIEILNDSGENITPAEYKDESFAANGHIKYFDLEDVEEYKSYTFNVKYLVDVTNGGEDGYNELVQEYKVKAMSGDGFDVGSMTATADINSPEHIRLVFYNSNKLNLAKKLHYFVYVSADEYWDGEVNFVPAVVSTSSGDYYYFTLSDVALTSAGNCYIQLQFLGDEDEVLAEESAEYLYIEE